MASLSGFKLLYFFLLILIEFEMIVFLIDCSKLCDLILLLSLVFSEFILESFLGGLFDPLSYPFFFMIYFFLNSLLIFVLEQL